METIIVEVCIGITGCVTDFILPAHVPVSALIEEIARLTEQVFPEITFGNERPLLCDLQSNSIISTHLTLAQANVRDGSRLLLV